MEPTELVPLRTLLEQATADSSIKNLAGEVKSFEQLLQPATLEALSEKSPGVLAYLAFHPTADVAVRQYITGGSLAGDSGSRILVLFTTDTRVWSRTTSDDSGLFAADAIPGVTVSSEVHPSYEMIRRLFDPAPAPPLPGIAFFKGFDDDAEAVYASLSGLDAAGVTQRLRELFTLSSAAADEKPDHFASALSVALQRKHFEYTRSGSTSVREWFIRGYQWLWDNKSDIIAVAGLIP